MAVTAREPNVRVPARERECVYGGGKTRDIVVALKLSRQTELTSYKAKSNVILLGSGTKRSSTYYLPKLKV